MTPPADPSPLPDPPPSSLLEKHAQEAAALEEQAAAVWATARPPEAEPLPPDPASTRAYRARRLLADLWWNLKLWLRWSRPKTRTALRPVRAGGEHLLFLALGQLRWGWRRFKTHRPTRLLTYQIAGGFGISVILFSLWLWAGKPLSDGFSPDDSVPAPQLDIMAEVESEAEPVTIDSALPPPTVSQQAEPLGPTNFRFELFAQRDPETGKLKLYNNAAERYITQWYPVGTPAKPLMSFVGRMLERTAGREVSFDERCMKLPINKVFREATITCTYAHPIPGPYRHPNEQRLRAFWIISMNYDNKLNIRDVQVYARLLAVAN